MKTPVVLHRIIQRRNPSRFVTGNFAQLHGIIRSTRGRFVVESP